ncbi:DsbA family oxidoreductase [Actinoalloteichus hymeniacidonis]|uniref:DSBA-like thioredoxin domain-containing protein n=1 Tax=Actinoalloteichus hymeniacidonis TaxID=340345 RepID=A0AAC9HNT4_9PSEU|nr:DsbA family oxidoreductase [Actinoalloteichus hymeniacidonis]AOS62749.1 hypothetical protein TL08_09670 [Actinoalloteichus hymeniacidonis]MBB5909220.1 putative DsbA family dithiol-disulfide isomerase [Actinoalloteichus hymeniacidonis]
MIEQTAADVPTDRGATSTLDVEIWFDFACPWCWIGARRWDAALARFAHADRVQTRWRSFELRPGYAGTPPRLLVEIMREDWAMDEATVTEILERIRSEGNTEGLQLRPESVRPVSTLDAHRLTQAAVEHGVGDAVRESLFTAYQRDLADLADRDLLTELAAAAGLDRAVAAQLWRTDAYSDVVHTEHARAAEVGATAVPAYRIGGGTHSGSLATEELLELLEEAWRARSSIPG